MSGSNHSCLKFLQETDTISCKALRNSKRWFGGQTRYMSYKEKTEFIIKKNFRSFHSSSTKQTFLASLPVNNIQWCKVIFHYQVSKVSFCFPAGSSISNHHCAAASREKQNEKLNELRACFEITWWKRPACTNTIKSCSDPFIYPSNLSILSWEKHQFMQNKALPLYLV